MWPFSFRCTNNSSDGLVSVSLPGLCFTYRILNCTNFTQTDGSSNAPLSSGSILVCSGFSKMFASLATYPHEVLRTRLQTQRRPLNTTNISTTAGEVHDRAGLVRTAQNIIRQEGWRSLYKGLSVNLFRTVPNSAVTMLT